MNYYNEWDKDAAAWTRELIKAGIIPPGDVDERSITEVKAHELTNYTQCHFFAGIGGWPLAFQLAGISPDENADTGSCPCQPFSGTGKQMGFADPRHLWPAFRRVIGKRQPATVYGEQVASKLGRDWLSRVFSDLAFMGYAGAGADLCSAGVGSPNIRQRLYWVGDASNLGHQRERGAWGRRDGLADAGAVDGMAEPNRITREQGGSLATGRTERGASGQEPGLVCGSSTLGLGYADHARREGRLLRWHGGYERAAGETSVAGPATLGGFWGVADIVYCRDEKWRRIEPGSFPLAHGVPSRVGPLLTELRKLGRSSIALARANRNIRLKGYGNAINPWVASQFIRAARSADLLGRVTATQAEPQPLCLDE